MCKTCHALQVLWIELEYIHIVILQLKVGCANFGPVQDRVIYLPIYPIVEHDYCTYNAVNNMHCKYISHLCLQVGGRGPQGSNIFKYLKKFKFG